MDIFSPPRRAYTKSGEGLAATEQSMEPGGAQHDVVAGSLVVIVVVAVAAVAAVVRVPSCMDQWMAKRAATDGS